MDDIAECREVLVVHAPDWTKALIVGLPAGKECFIEMHGNDARNHEVMAGSNARDVLAPTFHGGRAFGDSRYGDRCGRNQHQTSVAYLAHSRRRRARGVNDFFEQVLGDGVNHKLSGVFDVPERVFLVDATSASKPQSDDHGPEAEHGVAREWREVDDAIWSHGSDPRERARNDQHSQDVMTLVVLDVDSVQIDAQRTSASVVRWDHSAHGTDSTGRGSHLLIRLHHSPEANTVSSCLPRTRLAETLHARDTARRKEISAVNLALALMTETGSSNADLVELLGKLVAIIVATKLLGDLAQRIGQPAVLGELIAGILLGASVLGLIKPDDPVVHALAEIGVLVLLFEIGLHTDLRAVVAVGRTAATVALVGVVVPFTLGYGAVLLLGVTHPAAIVCGAALTATSIGISARVLSELGRLHMPEGQVVLGAAVLDDIVGLIILSVVAGMIGGTVPTASRVVVMSASALSFVLFAIIIGTRTVPYFFRVIVERARVSGALPLIALAFAFGLAWLADLAGSAPIIGAFAAGLILHPTAQKPEIEAGTTSIGHFFVPIFFASVGASVDLGALIAPRPLLIGVVLTIVAIIGKLVAGFAPWWFPGNSLLVGVAMVPRGEVGLIFAQMGLATGVLRDDLFGALMLMVLVTTLVTPPALAWVVREFPLLELGGTHEAPEEGGIDDLVAGARRRQRDRRRK